MILRLASPLALVLGEGEPFAVKSVFIEYDTEAQTILTLLSLSLLPCEPHSTAYTHRPVIIKSPDATLPDFLTNHPQRITTLPDTIPTNNTPSSTQIPSPSLLLFADMLSPIIK